VVSVKRSQLILVAIFIVFITSSCFNSNQSSKDVENDKLTSDEIGRNEENTDSDDTTNEMKELIPIEKQPTDEDLVEAMIESMTLEEKVGQLIIGGFTGTTMTEEVKELIHTYRLGGFILFAHNLESLDQSLELLNSIKKENEESEIPLFLSVDQEGGRVTRLPGLNNLITNREIGQKNDERFAYEFGKLLGNQLHAFGFNLNFAPVLDVNSNPNNPVIGDRSYGDEPGLVSALGVQTMQGLQTEGIISTIKHFPGHGDTYLDSHEALPIIHKTYDELKETELVPFENAIKSGAEMIMTAHILLPEMETTYPATMSKEIITEILRKEMGYSGVVITDDMTMAAITNNYGIDEAAVTSIKAGVDIVLIAHEFENIVKTYEHIIEAVNTGEITEKRIDESVARILLLKNKYELKDTQMERTNLDELNEAIINLNGAWDK